MAGLLALRSAETGRVWRLLRPTTAASLDITRKTGGNAAAPSVFPKTIRTMDDLPEVTSLTLLYRMIFKGYYNRVHELQLYEKQRHGSMYKTKFRDTTSIALSSVELIEELYRNDDKFPSRGDMSDWTDYRDMRGYGYGISIKEGEKWYKLRAILNTHMLHPQNYMKYDEPINEVITDFMKRIDQQRKMSATGDLVSNMSNELYRFSLEVISNILFEARIGSLEDEIPAETQDFITNISQVLTHTMTLAIVPKWTRNILPFWQRFVDGWDGVFRFAHKLIDKKMDDIQKRLDAGQEIGSGYLGYFLSNPNMTRKDVYGSIAELLLGGVDTSSNAMLWSLYLLSRDPKAQDRLYQEVSSIVKGDRIPTAEDVNNMPYLKAVTKETLRMYPVISSNVRLLSERDVVIGGHLIPKKTTFVTNNYAVTHDETVFPEPWSFKPERWLRDGRTMPNAFGSLPFGFGVRGCAGQRLAKLEIHLLLARIIKQFEVRPDPNVGEVKALNRVVIVADRPISFHFLERKDASA